MRYSRRKSRVLSNTSVLQIVEDALPVFRMEESFPTIAIVRIFWTDAEDFVENVELVQSPVRTSRT